METSGCFLVYASQTACIPFFCATSQIWNVRWVLPSLDDELPHAHMQNVIIPIKHTAMIFFRLFTKYPPFSLFLCGTLKEQNKIFHFFVVKNCRKVSASAERFVFLCKITKILFTFTKNYINLLHRHKYLWTCEIYQNARYTKKLHNML